MEVLLKSLAQHPGEALLGAGILILILLGWLLRLQWSFRKSHRRWRELFGSSTGETLEALLSDHLRQRSEQSREIEDLRQRVSKLEAELAVSKRHVGLVRYDAFEDVSGSQSFALALYDDRGDGAVLSGIIGRNDCRVYGKPLLNGRSDRNLSQEEQRAIREAKEVGVRSIISS